MHKATTTTLKSLFIFSTSLEKLNARIRELTIEARKSSFERDYRKVVLAANELVELSPESEPFGRYFQALALSQQGQGNRDKANDIFTQLLDSNITAIKAASQLALGVSAYRNGDYETAHSFIKKSNDSNVNAPLTSVWCETLRAAIYSANGEHYKSILTYQKVLPRLALVGKVFPAYVNLELNNFAYDLAQAGECKAASQIINQVITSPLISAYPEWLETKREIDEKLRVSQNPKPDKSNQFALRYERFQHHRQKFRNNSGRLRSVLAIHIANQRHNEITLTQSEKMNANITKQYLHALTAIASRSFNTSAATIKSFCDGKALGIHPIAYRDFVRLDKLIGDLKSLIESNNLADQCAG